MGLSLITFQEQQRRQRFIGTALLDCLDDVLALLQNRHHVQVHVEFLHIRSVYGKHLVVEQRDCLSCPSIDWHWPEHSRHFNSLVDRVSVEDFVGMLADEVLAEFLFQELGLTVSETLRRNILSRTIV